MMNDEQRPDEQRDGETDLQFAWFRAFLAMGPGRSMRAAYKAFSEAKSPKVAKSRHKTAENVSPSWRAASAKWDWHQRATAFDEAESDRALDENRARRRALASRLLGTVEKQVERAEQVDAWAERVLNSRRYRAVEITEGGKTVTVEPAAWSFADGIKAASVAARSIKSAADLLETLDRIDTRNWQREMAAIGQRGQAATGDPMADETAPTPKPTEARARENLILDGLEDALLLQLSQQQPGVEERLLAIHDRRVRLNGLVKPFDPGAENPAKENRDYSHVPPHVLEMLIDALNRAEAKREAAPGVKATPEK